MITFPGTRKTRAREPDASALSSSAPPAPTPLAPALAPSSPSAQSTNLLVPMLESLHHGLCLVMQSIHDLAQHRPIINMKDFVAQVAWLRVHPSPLGAGEAPTAQESQPESEVTPEAIPEETPEDTPAATPIEDVDYYIKMNKTPLCSHIQNHDEN